MLPAQTRRRKTGQATKGATHLIKVASEAAVGKRKFVEVFGTDYPTPDGTCIRDYIHVMDLAAAHRLALARLRDGGRNLTANCGYSRGYSVLEVLHAVERVNETKLDIRLSNRRPGDPMSIVADSKLARREFGWTPQFDSLDAIISSALKWERDRCSLLRRSSSGERSTGRRRQDPNGKIPSSALFF